MNLNQIGLQAFMNATKKGFHPEHIVNSRGHCTDIQYMAVRVALIHSEASEALEELRNTPFDMEKFSAELADIIIRTADLARMAGVDLDRAVESKMKYNVTREHRHGGRAI